MDNLLKASLGITETKIAMFDILIRYCKSSGGLITRKELEAMREVITEEAKKSELNEVFANQKSSEVEE